MTNFSILAEHLRKAEGEKFTPKTQAVGTRSPSPHSTSRLSLGTLGARRLQTRDVDAGEKREKLQLASPMGKRFLERQGAALFTSRKARAVRAQQQRILQGVRAGLA